MRAIDQAPGKRAKARGQRAQVGFRHSSILTRPCRRKARPAGTKRQRKRRAGSSTTEASLSPRCRTRTAPVQDGSNFTRRPALPQRGAGLSPHPQPEPSGKGKDDVPVGSSCGRSRRRSSRRTRGTAPGFGRGRSYSLSRASSGRPAITKRSMDSRAGLIPRTSIWPE